MKKSEALDNVKVFSSNCSDKKALVGTLSFLIILSLFVLCVQLYELSAILSLGVALLFMLFILVADEKYSLLLLFYLIPCGAMFDLSGFTFILNFSIALFFLRNSFLRGGIFRPSFFLWFFFFLYEVFLLAFRNQFSVSSLFSSVSNFIAFGLLFSYFQDFGKRNLNFSYCYFAFFIGLLYSALAGYFYSGATIKDMFSVRQVGLTRDANYLALFALMAIFSYDSFFTKKFSLFAVLIKVICLFIGLLTTSKMFLLLFSFGFLLSLILNWQEIISNKKFLWTLVVLFVAFLIFLSFGFFDSVIESYLQRFSGDLTTGRIQIALDFLNLYFESPGYVLFGASSSYYNFYNVVYNSEHMYLHCTYLELPIAYGLFGTAFFILEGIVLFRQIKMRDFSLIRSSSFLSILIFLIGIAALPLLTSDLLPISLLFLLIGYRSSCLRIQSFRNKNVFSYLTWEKNICLKN